MKVTLPKLDTELYEYSMFGDTQIPVLLAAWFRIKTGGLLQIFPAGCSLKYNHQYHFYDWSLFYWDRERETHIQYFLAFLKSQGLRVETSDTVTLLRKDGTVPAMNRTKTPGLRLWIYPSE